VAPKTKPKRRKAKPVPDLIRRHRALAATMQEFAGKELVLGQADCAKLVRFHLLKMGHRGVPRPGSYSSPAGAAKALKEMGFKNLEELFDSLLERIPPAFMRPGDIAVVKAERGAPAWRVGTVVISIGRKFLGWHPDHPVLAVIHPTVDEPFVAAWRV
jgi:hypothetical protein